MISNELAIDKKHLNHHMHNSYANIVSVLGICKLFSHNL